MSQLRFKQQEVGLSHVSAVRLVEEAQARKIRIRLLVGAAGEQWADSLRVEESLVSEITSTAAGKVWTEKMNEAFDRKIDLLGTLSLRVLEKELQAALEES